MVVDIAMRRDERLVSESPARPRPTFGDELRRFRLRKNASQNWLAHLAGVNPAYVCRLERGDSIAPSRLVVLSFAAVLSLDLDDLDHLLALAGLLPESVRLAGGWDAYRSGLRGSVRRVR
jgi:transcriptional regulator with XRE-family HTH domain